MLRKTTIRRIALSAAATACITCGTITSTMAGQPYVVVTNPQPRHAHSIFKMKPSVPTRSVQATPYAYGWFGQQPKSTWVRHFGYHRNFTQWSAK